ncbi:MAG: DUF3048 domain-containing protein [Bacilli bacterium]|nr:DUF3048 domain-containing protein [Bacilli bacterium]
MNNVVKQKWFFPVIGLVILLLIGGFFAFTQFNGKKKNDEPAPTPDTPAPVVEPKKVSIIDVESKNRSIAVMINNIGVARPLQSGLQDAYIIYEIIVEGGITRYMAVFQDQNTARIGSIRSARHYFLDYALENDAIYVHNGQSPQAQSDFSALGIDHITAEAPKTGIRDKSLNVSSEHTLFTSMDLIKNGIGSKRTERKRSFLLTYSVDSIDLASIENSKTANSVSIKYSNSSTSSYEYDEANKVYKRFVNGKAHTDYVTKNQYTFKNIITYQVNNYNLNDGSGKGRQGLDNIGSGTGYYISEGIAVPIKWTKKDRATQTKYTLMDGTPLTVNDGNTFIQIQPSGQTLTIN